MKKLFVTALLVLALGVVAPEMSVYAADSSSIASINIDDMSASELYNKYWELHKAGDYQNAWNVLKKYAQKDESGYGYFLMGERYRWDNKYWDAGVISQNSDKAEECYINGIKTADKSNSYENIARNNRNMADLYSYPQYNKLDYTKALKHYKLALEAYEKCEEAEWIKEQKNSICNRINSVNLSILYEKYKKAEEDAKSLAEKIAQKKPSPKEKAKINKKYKKAWKLLNSYVKKEDSGYAYYLLGNKYRWGQEYWDAKVIKKSLSKAEKYYKIGLKKAIASEDEDYTAINTKMLADLYFSMEYSGFNTDKAYEYYRYALDAYKKCDSSATWVVNAKKDITAKINFLGKKPQIKKCVNDKSGKVHLSISNNEKANWMIIEWSQSSEFKKSSTNRKCIYPTNSATRKVELRNLKKGKTYYVRVFLIKKNKEGKDMYSSYSEPKKIKIKK